MAITTFISQLDESHCTLYPCLFIYKADFDALLDDSLACFYSSEIIEAIG